LIEIVLELIIIQEFVIVKDQVLIKSMLPHLLKILIVEDDVSLGIDLELMLKELGYTVIGVADSSSKATRMIELKNPDLILMDINLKGNLSGIELAENLCDLKIPILFITGYNLEKNFKLASKVNHIGFMVKPIHKYSLQSTIEQAFKNISAVANDGNSPLKKDTILFNKKGVLFRIAIHDINYVKANDDYTITITTQGEFVNAVRLFKMEKDLKPFGFVKCHRSYLINPSKVVSFDTNRNEIHIDDTVIPVSRNNKAEVIESLDIVKRNRK